MNIFKVYFLKNRLNAFGIILLSVFIGITSFGLSEKIKIVFNEGILRNNITTLENNIFILFVIFIILFFLNVFSSVLNNVIQWKGTKNLKLYAMNKIFGSKYDYFLENQPTSIWTELNISSSKVADYYTSVVSIFSKAIEFIVYLLIIININVYAGIFTLLTIPFVYIFTLGVKKKMAFYQNKMLEKSRELSSVSIESLENINNIKVKNENDFFIKIIDKKHTELNNNIIKSAFYENYWSFMTSLINSIAPILVIFLLMKFTDLITIDSGEIIILYSFIPIFLSTFKTLYSYIMNYYTSKPYLQSIKKFFNLEGEKDGDFIIKNFETLETKNLKIMHGKKIISIPDFNIKKGEKVLISGESGIGKSSFFNLILGLNDNYTGIIKINGHDLKDFNVSSLRKIFGISFQSSGIFSLNLKENISLGKSYTEKEIDKVINIANLQKQLKEKNEALLSNNILSGGEKSRINIAQNLFRTPEVILLDESLSSVDEEMESDIIKNIVENFTQNTIICISHRKSSEKYFEKIISFQGEII
ncbi:MAG TPA: ABC transporter ATP-binding protein [Tepiditoga sp.]|nr:ABC transporter ATP-binding protein [Thermotogota bacterium]HOO74420.1 ABC transporter ATP-binding protein [Tepiditoga sp.]